MHGGISPKLNKLSDLTKIKIPLDISTDDALQLDLLWADPSGDVDTFEKNVARGCSKLFSVQDVYATCERLNLKLIVRAHQPFNRGFGFFAGKRLLTLFGAVDHAAKGSYAGVLHLQLEKAQDKKGKPTGKLEIQAGIILFRPTTKETKGKHKFLMEFEELGTADIDTEDETTQLERMGKMPTEEEIREAMKD
uniref:SER_THR_PHOSPHATASE domain-containing protein n=1 Tax=Meloidogyne hapla TaxID=6305 RepID=A0A1I8BWT5_MELHA